METKERTCIVDACINAPTFDHVSFQPSLVNFFYGRNGVGKSTVARALRQDDGITWEKEKLPVYLYNDEYIERNINSYGRMDGVFTISEESSQLAEEIQKKEKEKVKLQKALQKCVLRIKKQDSAITSEDDQHRKTLWRATADLRSKYANAIDAELRNDVDQFADAIDKTAPINADDKHLELQFEMAFGGEQAAYQEYESLPRMKLPEIELIDIPILSKDSSAFARFCRAVGNLDWVMNGHHMYQHAAGDQCPYCQQRLPEHFAEQLAACFDDQYKEDLKQLQDQSNARISYLQGVWKVLNRNVENAFPGVLSLKYKKTAELLMEKIQSQIRTIEEKLQNPAGEYHLEDLRDDCAEIRQLTDEINQKIKAYMDAVADLPGEQEKCRKILWAHMAAICDAENQRHSEAQTSLFADQVKLQKQKELLERQIAVCEKDLEHLRQSTVNTKTAMEAINRLLLSNGLCGFYLREKPDETNHYELVRDTGVGTVIAQGLSEGERHLLAFLYFFYEVMGSSTEDGRQEDKIVVIDDPVSSMDSSTLATVASLTRTMIESCRDNARNARNPITSPVRQVFCLTHNPVFFRAISYACVEDYRYCSFFEILKNRQNQSAIRLLEEETHDFEVQKVNQLPMLNDYENAWWQYFHTDDPITLLDVCRRILHTYFLRICGHQSGSFRKEVLDHHQDAFIGYEDGKPDRTVLNIADAMLCLMDDAGQGIMDSMYFDVRAHNTDQLRSVFKKIFDIMQSTQHYEYMERQLNGRRKTA